MKLSSWLKRKKAALCILAGICAISLFAVITSQEKIKLNSGGSYAVRIKHYGIDAAEIERSITIPLEDALFSIPGIMSVLSSSENSQSSVIIRFKSGTHLAANFSKHGRYEAVRDAAQRVYETLPPSAQRPEILSSNNSMIPVWSAAVLTNNSTADFDNSPSEELKENVLTSQMQTMFLLEKNVKPVLESLEGAGEVIVSGIGIKEIYIILDQEKINLLGLEPSAVSSVLAMNDSIFSGGTYKEVSDTVMQHDREIIISVDGRYGHYSALNKALIPLDNGKFTELSEIALIIEQEREPDILSRLNGRKTVSIAIMGRDGADLRKLSSGIKRELSSLNKDQTLPLEFIVLSDLGAEEASAFQSVLYAALSGAIMVAIISFLLSNKNNVKISGFFCALAVPLICLISTAILLVIGFSPDKLLLAGIAAGIAAAIDAVILCSEKLRKCNNFNSASAALTSLTGPLLAGAATTVAALIPLTLIEDSSARIIANTIAVVTITAFILSLTLLPPLLLWGINSPKNNNNIFKLQFITNAGKYISKKAFKYLAASVRFCFHYPLVIILISIVITISAILMLCAKGYDTGSSGSEDSVYAQVEFEGGLLAEEVDRILSIYSIQLLNNAGINNIETGARVGSGSLLISFDPGILKTQQVREMAKQIQIPGGFVFFLENSQKDRYWEIFIYGDEDKKCRELAEQLAHICAVPSGYADHSFIKERVLNFKQGSNKMILYPNREILAKSKISFSIASNMVRIGVYSPVAYKRINAINADSNSETDVRIKTGNIEVINNYSLQNSIIRQTREDVMGTLVPTINEKNITPLQLNSLIRTEEDAEPSSIKRENRRRYASITILTKPMDPRRVKHELSAIFKKLDLPPGYSIEFDPEAIRESDNLSATVLSLIMAIIFCYIILAVINESFTIPLVVLSAIPPSLAIPAICLFLSGNAYNTAIACAFIAVSGMTVNASVLCVDSIRSVLRNGRKKTILTVYLAIRRKIPALLATTGTTIAGAIPFLFLTENANILIRTLSLVGALGVTGSLICSITVIPSLLSININTFKQIKHTIPLVRSIKLFRRNT